MLKRAFRSSFKLSCSNFIAAIISVVSMPLLISKIGLEVFGVYVIYQTVIFVVFKLFDFKTWEAVASLVYSFSKKKHSELICAAIIIDLCAALGSMLFACALYIAMGLWTDLINDTLDLFIICILTLPCLQVGAISAPYRLNNQYGMIAAANVLSSVVRLALIIALPDQAGLKSALIIYFISELIRMLSLLLPNSGAVIKSNQRISVYNIKILMSKAKWTWFSGVVDLPLSQLDRFVVGYFLNMEAVGLYQIIRRLGAVVGMGAAPLYQVLLPEMMKEVKAKRKEHLKKLISKFSYTIFALCISAFTLAYLSSPYWKTVFGGQLGDYEVTLIMIYLLVEIFSVTFIHYQSSYIAIFGVKVNAIVTLLLNVVFAVLLMLGLVSLGIEGAIIAIFIHFCLTITIKAIGINNWLVERVV